MVIETFVHVVQESGIVVYVTSVVTSLLPVQLPSPVKESLMYAVFFSSRPLVTQTVSTVISIFQVVDGVSVGIFQVKSCQLMVGSQMLGVVLPDT